MSFKKGISYHSHMAKKLHAQQFSQNCFSKKAADQWPSLKTMGKIGIFNVKKFKRGSF